MAKSTQLDLRPFSPIVDVVEPGPTKVAFTQGPDELQYRAYKSAGMPTPVELATYLTSVRTLALRYGVRDEYAHKLGKALLDTPGGALVEDALGHVGVSTSKVDTQAELVVLRKRVAMLEAERGPGIKHQPEVVISCDIDWD